MLSEIPKEILNNATKEEPSLKVSNIQICIDFFTSEHDETNTLLSLALL